MNPAKHSVTRGEQIARAMLIKKSLGTLVAARYMRRRGWSIEAALFVLGR